ncbi:hypothetical protein PC9H_005882 [Pleurotus ostreatus]|uniref:Uncharacterized protein n=1 Tax=Pleurotus ostreatus TaxID=5322 RepID=A0A8H6ZWZ7_PLEOS|nr:uncharacterized protein PC9H_005882 [Pleurotus ostreatus]KAF7430182.1 hypothetical protein PC9H_005882 [Pleurotus ostreatus]KAJ8701250.1 hypothetical protein PTI98_000060 [Pleurotus ostreatus]
MEPQSAEAKPNDRTISSVTQVHEKAIQELTKSNRAFFLCLKSFFENHKREGWLKRLVTSSTPVDKAYQSLHHHAGSFFRLVESSIRVSSAGVAITKMAIFLLSAPAGPPIQVIQLATRLRPYAVQCRLEAKKMENACRELRTQIMDTYKSVGFEVESYNKHDMDNTDALQNIQDGGLLKALTDSVGQLADTITKLVSWWGDVEIDLSNITNLIDVSRGVSLLIRTWEDLQRSYQLYNKEIMVQQDYYKSELRYALPNRGLLSFFRK